MKKLLVVLLSMCLSIAMMTTASWAAADGLGEAAGNVVEQGGEGSEDGENTDDENQSDEEGENFAENQSLGGTVSLMGENQSLGSIAGFIGENQGGDEDLDFGDEDQDGDEDSDDEDLDLDGEEDLDDDNNGDDENLDGGEEDLDDDEGDGDDEDAVAKIGDTLYESVCEALEAAEAGDTVYLIADAYETESAWLEDGTKDAPVTLDLNGYNVYTFVDGTFITVNEGCFVLQDMDDDGALIQCADGDGAIYVGSNGSFYMYGGHIKDYRAYNGGGVYVSGGLFEMHGGYITNCSATEAGGGVYVANYGVFNMDMGTISECKADAEGGGVYVDNSEFNMIYGTISGCEAGSNGGGVAVSLGEFNMSGGSIDNCCAPNSSGGGVYIQVGEFNMSSGSIYYCEANYGAGVDNFSGELNLTGGSILDCKAGSAGGGIYNENDMYISGNVLIMGSTAAGEADDFYIDEEYGTLTLDGEFSGIVYISADADVKAGDAFGKAKEGASGAEYFYCDQNENLVGSISDGQLTWCTLYELLDGPEDATWFFDSEEPLTYRFSGEYSEFVRAEIDGEIVGSSNYSLSEGSTIISFAPEYLVGLDEGLHTLKMWWENGMSFTYFKLGEKAVKVGDKYYSTVAEAMNNVEAGDTVVLLKDVTETYDLFITGGTEEKPITLDLNGHKLTWENPYYGIEVEEGGVFKLTDGSQYQTGVCIQAEGDGMFYPASGFISIYGTFILEAGSIEDATASFGGCMYVDEGGIFEMTGGSILNCNALAGGAIYNRGTVNLSGGSIKNCCSEECGGGIYNEGIIKISGRAVVCENENSSGESDNIFLAEDGTLILEGKFAGSIGISSENEFKAGVCFGSAGKGASGAENIFCDENKLLTGSISDGKLVWEENYRILNNKEGLNWVKGEKTSLVFKGSGELKDFVRAEVDGAVVDPSNYTLAEGSTIIAFVPSYLEKLTTGKHTLNMVWNEGSALTEFTIEAKGPAADDSKVPPTGDESNALLWMLIMAGVILAAVGAGAYLKKKSN